MEELSNLVIGTYSSTDNKEIASKKLWQVCVASGVWILLPANTPIVLCQVSRMEGTRVSAPKLVAKW